MEALASVAAEAEAVDERCEICSEGCLEVKPAAGWWYRANQVPEGATWALRARCCGAPKCRAAACPPPPRKSRAKPKAEAILPAIVTGVLPPAGSRGGGKGVGGKG